ncbi:hypothetical protein QQP08_013513 [Theobroma cacao]|nr:hypothetical protein QQP08_013513 [Theobroma cacao]
MRNDEGIQAYSDRVLRIVNELRFLGEVVTKGEIVAKFLISLRERFEEKITSLEDSKDLTKLTVNELINNLLALEQRRAMRTNYVENALVSKTKGLKLQGSGSKKGESKGNKSGNKSGEVKQGNKDLFFALDTSFQSKVKIGNGTFMEILGIGTMNVEIASDQVGTVFDPHGDELTLGRCKDTNRDEVENPTKGQSCNWMNSCSGKAKVVPAADENLVQNEIDDDQFDLEDESKAMITKNETWKLVDRPVDKNVIGVKWIYRTKLNLDGFINKYKARLVMKSYA